MFAQLFGVFEAALKTLNLDKDCSYVHIKAELHGTMLSHTTLKSSTCLRHELFLVNQTYNSLTIVV